jgi:uncharacterized membrane protein (UPF0127 family)
MRAFNIRNSKQLAVNVTVADNLFTRMKGLLGKSEMMSGEALWIKPCMSVHTFGMKFPIDIIFLDKKNKVVSFINNIKPNRMTRLYFGAASALELPAGITKATEIEVGDKIEIL